MVKSKENYLFIAATIFAVSLALSAPYNEWQDKIIEAQKAKNKQLRVRHAVISAEYNKLVYAQIVSEVDKMNNYSNETNADFGKMKDNLKQGLFPGR